MTSLRCHPLFLLPIRNRGIVQMKDIIASGGPGSIRLPSADQTPKREVSDGQVNTPSERGTSTPHTR